MSASASPLYGDLDSENPVARGLLREWWSTADPIRWPDAPDGAGRSVLLIPGFPAGDGSLRQMALWLRSGGFRTHRSGIAINVACMEKLVSALEHRLEEAVEQEGARATVVGQSRGGVLGWVLAMRRLDLVEHLITLGSPICNQLSVLPSQWVSIGVVGALGTLRVPGLFRYSCRSRACCERAREELRRPLPEGVRATSVYSRDDRVVRWQACLAPGRGQVGVRSSHIGMGVDVEVWHELSDRL